MRRLIELGLVLATAGCFTLHETPRPAAPRTAAAAGRDTTVKVNGFAANVTEYVSVHGYGTVVGGGGWYYDRWGRVWGSPMESQIVHTETLVPQTHATDLFLKRAETAFEESGYIVKAPNPDWLVEVTFGPPTQTGSDEMVRALWILCSILSCDYGTEIRTAKLKIYDNRTGRLVHHKDFSVRYQVAMWSPIPFFGPASYDRTSPGYRQQWCLTSLTDQCVAEATSWLAKK